MRAERIEQLEKRNRQLHASRKAIAAGQAAGTVIGSLVEIMLDPAHSTRARLQAAENLLAYKTPPNIAERAKLYLTTVFTDPGQNIDHRLQATKALRSAEDVRLMPPIERARTDDSAKVEEPVIPLADLIAQRRAYANRMEQERLASPEATPEEKQAIRAAISRRNGNGQDD
jgi:hypothetical protein